MTLDLYRDDFNRKTLWVDAVLVGLRALVSVEETVFAADTVLARYDHHFGAPDVKQCETISSGETAGPSHVAGGSVGGTASPEW